MENKIDFLCLGQTVPEEGKKYGLRVCTAGWDVNNECLVRIYPLGVNKDHHFKRWHIYKNLPVRNNPKDSRKESWRLNIDITDLSTIDCKKYDGNRIAALKMMFDLYGSKDIITLNQSRKSLAIINMVKPHGYFENKSKIIQNVNQLSMFEDLNTNNMLGKNGFDYLPRIEFKDELNKPHKLMFNSWDAYMHQINLAPKYGKDNLWNQLKLSPKDNKLALIGNMNHQMNAWLIISTF